MESNISEVETNPTAIFWSRMQEEIGQIVPHLRNILTLQGLAANRAIGDITPEDIVGIEQEMQRDASRLREKFNRNGESMSDYYGIYADKPDEFRFNVGDRKVFETITKTVHEQGIKKFLQPIGTSSNLSIEPNAKFPLFAADEQATNLIARIKGHYSNKIVDLTFNRVLEAMEASCEKGSGGRIIGRVTCPICCRKVKLLRDPARSWQIQNMVRHFEGHRKISKKNNSLFGEMETKNFSDTISDNELVEDNCPADKTELLETPVNVNNQEMEETFENNNMTTSDVLNLDDTITSDPLQDTDTNNYSSLQNETIYRGSQNEDELRDDDEFSMVEVLEEAETTLTDDTITTLDESVFLNTLLTMHTRVKDMNVFSRRYSDLEKDICTFNYLTAGNSHYQYLEQNMATMTKKTIQRHMRQFTINICEGQLDVTGLKQYLVQNGFPMAVALCEDGTRITAAAEYDYISDSIKGLVAPMDQNGLPRQHMFVASSPTKMINDLKSYPMGNHAYVQLALPLATHAAPFTIYHTCSNNKFEYTDIIKRWQFTEELLRKEGITVVAHASDGDPRLLKAMKQRIAMEMEHELSANGSWYKDASQMKTPIYVQDMIHTINKFRNRFLNAEMNIGDYTINKQHLKDLINEHSKDKHGLCLSDIDLKDKMKFNPTLKLIKPELMSFLEENIPGSKGTATFLSLMKHLHRSFIEIDVPPLDRVRNIWIVNYFVRAWMVWCKQKYNNLKQCITTNAASCVEINAHAIILFIIQCRERNAPEQFLMDHLSSQPCEKIFRQLRSMATTNQTVVNFSAKELTEKLKRIHMKWCIMYKYAEVIEFPSLTLKGKQTQSYFSMPSDDEIKTAVEEAEISVKEILMGLGIDINSVDMDAAIYLMPNCIQQEPEFIDIENDIASENSYMNAEGNVYVLDDDGLEMDKVKEVLNSSHNPVENSKADKLSDIVNDDVFENNRHYKAAKMFPNFNKELKLTSSRVGNRHTFKIIDSRGVLKIIKKSSFLWMWTEGRHRLSNDRMRRFQQREYRKNITKKENMRGTQGTTTRIRKNVSKKKNMQK